MRFTVLISLLFTVNLFAQDVIFDDPHATDGAIYLSNIDGEEVVLNAEDEILQLHDVFRMAENERIEAGFTKRIESSSNNRSEANLVFNLTYLDQVNATGNGFDDPVHGASRRAILEAAFAYYATLIENDGVCDIEIRESFSGNPNSNPFAYSAAYYFGSKGFNQPFTQAHITTGMDPYGPYPDGYMQFNFHTNLNYSYDVEGLPTIQQYDFYTIVLHEILHVLGFTSYATASGESAASQDVYTSFDEFLADYNKSPVFEVSGAGSSAAVSGPEDGALTNNQVWFELYAGQHAPVFSPDPFNGSSIDHFDNSRSDHGEYLMHPSLSKGNSFKVLHEDEARVLELLGYTVNYSIATSVPEQEIEGSASVNRSSLYPNPALNADRIQIDLGDYNGEEVLVIVYDMMGRESYSKVILNRGPGPITAIDPYHNLTPGMYIVIGSSKDELFNEKLVIR